MNSQRKVAVIRWALSFLLLGGIVLVFHRWLHVNSTTVALVLLLVILAVASTWSLRLAVLMSVTATLAYNFFFLPPFGTLTISDPENWIALIVLLATAVIGSRLSQRARDDAQRAHIRQREMEMLLELSKQLLRTEEAVELMVEIPHLVVAATSASSCVLYLSERDQIYSAGLTRTAMQDAESLRALSTALSEVSVTELEISIVLQVGVKPRGVLVVSGVQLSAGAAAAMGGLISVAIDRVRALEEAAHNEASKESERLRTLMLDSITHELRTPLTSIKGAATALLVTAPEADSTQRELLTIVDEETDRIDRLIGQATEMAKLDAGELHMRIAATSVSELIQSALATCSWIRADHEVDVQIPQDAEVASDRAYIEKALCNVLENAAKYSPRGGYIRISAEITGGEVLIHIADQGKGIDPGEQMLIFDRFYRGVNHSQRIAGTGMGLAITKAIVERHGGRLSLISQVGRGSVFTLAIPRVALLEHAERAQ